MSSTVRRDFAVEERDTPLNGLPPDAAVGLARTAWWVYLVIGVAWLLYGMLVLSLRPTGVASLAILAGLAFMFGGITQFFIAARLPAMRWLFYIAGVLGILAGILAFVWPGETLLVMAVIIAWYLAISGVFTVVASFVERGREWWWVQLLLGVAEFLLGAWAIGSPGRELLLLINLVGLYMVFFGISEIFTAFALRSDVRTAESTTSR